ncbi:substrate-binding periplasmic protein [Vibrio ostreicida]|uniref:substrate-binding periplasmic protein n=1 Tax=Vibrio ostreicida TaxID=526588 RepID=UPI003B5CD952
MRLFFWLVLSNLLTGIGWASAVSVTIYSDNNIPPYSYYSDGKLVGIYPDIVRSVTSKMPNYDVTLKGVPWNRGLMLLKHGQGFALLPPYFLPDERPYIWPYSEPLFPEKVSIFCHKSVVDKLEHPISWPSSFYGLRIGVNTGYNLGDPRFWEAVESGHIKVQAAKTPEANILMLYNKRNDCYVHIALSAKWAAKKVLEQQLISDIDWFVSVKDINASSSYLGYTAVGGLFPFKNEFVEMFNKEFLRQKEVGLIDKIAAPYLD